MYLAFVLLLGFCCVALLYNGISIQLRNIQVQSARLFLVCFGLPVSNKKVITYSRASLAMTKTPKIWNVPRFRGVFVIARPCYNNSIFFSSIRPKLVIARPTFKQGFLFSSAGPKQSNPKNTN
jgi:hypothetical protein